MKQGSTTSVATGFSMRGEEFPGGFKTVHGLEHQQVAPEFAGDPCGNGIGRYVP